MAETRTLKFYTCSESHYQKIKDSDISTGDNGGHKLEDNTFYITTSDKNVVENANLYFEQYKITDFISLNDLFYKNNSNIIPNLDGSNIPRELGLPNKLYYWIDTTKIGHILQLYYFNETQNAFVGLKTKTVVTSESTGSSNADITLNGEKIQLVTTDESEATVYVPRIDYTVKPKKDSVLTYNETNNIYEPKELDVSNIGKSKILPEANYITMKNKGTLDPDLVYYVKTEDGKVHEYLGEIEVSSSTDEIVESLIGELDNINGEVI